MLICVDGAGGEGVVKAGSGRGEAPKRLWTLHVDLQPKPMRIYKTRSELLINEPSCSQSLMKDPQPVDSDQVRCGAIFERGVHEECINAI